MIGDTTHGKGRTNVRFRERYGLHRLFLHAHRLRFIHPVTELPVDLMAPLPRELLDVIEGLAAEAAGAGE